MDRQRNEELIVRGFSEQLELRWNYSQLHTYEYAMYSLV